MPKYVEGKMDARGKRVALVVSRFNELITSRLADGAVDALVRHGAADNDIAVFRVPGSLEISPVARKLALSGKYDAVIAIGAVIRGDTPHFDYIAAEVAKGIAQTSLEAEIPVVFGVLTTDSLDQALERAGAKAGNKGAEAAMSAIEMMSLYGGGEI
ncbi:MAG: 6,7-dimethyl-8-ribityllumazine synthase [Candidatus Glassbacteria bacterium]|nr:6,7-dimethyl-8-ribityllumazine synthase [Candidatus Glassbacteria bacterium]